MSIKPTSTIFLVFFPLRLTSLVAGICKIALPYPAFHQLPPDFLIYPTQEILFLWKKNQLGSLFFPIQYGEVSLPKI
jgi:hypothetical protein